MVRKVRGEEEVEEWRDEGVWQGKKKENQEKKRKKQMKEGKK